jgi:adenosine deaminase
LTVCPISNDYVSDGTKAAAIKTMLEEGMLVTVNSDDPAYFPGYMSENLARVQEEVDLSDDDIAQLVRNSFEASWLDDDDRAEYLGRVEAFTKGA